MNANVFVAIVRSSADDTAMKRKPIQIAPTNEPGYGDMLYVLCDDGTLWAVRYREGLGEWNPLPAVPQDDVPSI